MQAFTPLGFALRLVAAIALVLCTYNPTGYSFYQWVAASFPHITPAAAVVGIALLVGWIIFLSATMRSIGFLGMALAVAFFAAVIWMIVSWGWLDPHNAAAMTWIVLLIFAVILAVGISWSHVRRRLTGQTDVDEVDAK